MFKKTLVALACATATLASGAAHAEKHVLKIAHFWPAGALSHGVQRLLNSPTIAWSVKFTLPCS